MTFGRTPLSPLLKVVLLHGSKLINLSNLGLSRWHYPDSYIYWHAFPVIPSDLRNVIHIPQGRGEDFPSHQLHLFYRPTPSFYPHQFLRHPLKFSDDCTLFKIQFYHKVTQYKSGGKVHSEHTFAYSPSHSRSRTTPWATDLLFHPTQLVPYPVHSVTHRFSLPHTQNTPSKKEKPQCKIISTQALWALQQRLWKHFTYQYPTDKQTSRRQSIATFKNWGLNVFLQAPPLWF